MRAKTAMWAVMTVLVVALSALMPEAVLRLQDRNLEGQVQSQVTETADLSLLAELSPAQTLAMATQHQSRVALEQGREMDAVQAERTAANILNADVFSMYYMADHTAPSAAAVSAQPWLYMGPTGENVIFWQVELSGAGYNPLTAVFDDQADPSPFTATALVDERSERVVSLRVQWTDVFLADAGTAAEVPAAEQAADGDAAPTVAPTPWTDPAEIKQMEEQMQGEPLPEDMDWDMAATLCEQLVFGLADELASYSYGVALDPGTSTALLQLDGESVTVPVAWTAAELRFNA